MAPSDRDAFWAKGSVVKGRYEVRGSERGGMGEVYFAFDRELDRMVAVKTPLPAVLKSEDKKARFFREAEAWIALGIHPNVCSAYYVQNIDGFPRLFIEYVSGGSLADWIRKKKDFPFDQKLDIAIQIAVGMQYTHTFSWKDETGSSHEGLVHRDLKPANILMEEDGTALITDFGLVGRGTDADAPLPAESPPPAAQEEMIQEAIATQKPSGGSWKTVTVDGAAIGTPAYMAPEQWKSTHLSDTPVDIYAFGCILYELFCGRRPFALPKKYLDAAQLLQLFQWEKMHREGAPQDPKILNPGLDGELAEWILQCLEKNSADRPRSFEVLKGALKSIYARVEQKPYLKPEPALFNLVADSLNNQGASYITIGQKRRAETAWREALAADPHHIEATFNLALYEWRHRGISDTEVFRRMEELQRTHTDTWRDERLVGKVYLIFGEYTKAAARLRKAAEMETPSMDLLKDLGLTLCAEAGMFAPKALWKEVASCFKAVMDRGYVDRYVAVGYAMALKQQGLKDRARHFFDQAIKQYADMPVEIDEAVRRFIPGHEIWASVHHAGKIDALTFSADSVRILWGNDRQFYTWGTRKKDFIQKSLLDDTKGEITSMAICPAREVAVAGGINQPLGLWNMHTGKLIDRFEPVTSRIGKLCISRDGSTALSGNPNGLVMVWDLKTRKRRQILSEQTKRITTLAFASGGEQALSAAEDLTICLWDIQKAECLRSFAGHTGKINAAAFSPNGRYILSGSDDRTLRLWDIEENRCRHVFEGHADRVTTVAFSPDGQYILSGSTDKTLRIWNFRQRHIEHLFRFENQVHNFAMSPDGHFLALVSSASLLILEFNLRDRYRAPYALTVPVTASTATARDLAFREHMDAAHKHLEDKNFPSALSAIQAARGVDGYARSPEALTLWTALTSRFPSRGLRAAWESTTIPAHDKGINDISVCCSGTRVLTVGKDRSLRLWNLETGACEQTFEGHTDQVVSVAVTPRGRYAVSGSRDHTLRIWDIREGSCVHEFMGHAKPVTSVDVSPDERFALSGSEDGGVRVWDLEEKICIRILEEHSGPVSAVRFGPDARYAASGSWKGKVRLWDLESGKGIGLFKGHEDVVTAISFSPDGRYIISASEDRRIRCWNIKKGSCLRTLQGHRASITATAVSPDGRYAVSGSHDKTLRLWKLESGTCIRKFEGHTNRITSVDFWPHGQSIVSASEGKIVRLWHLDWDPRIPEPADWDEAARPYLKTFLTLNAPCAAGSVSRRGKPSWDKEAFQDLMDDLGYRGFGWLSQDGIRKELNMMTRAWTGPPPVPKPVLKKVSGMIRPSDVLHWLQRPAVWIAILFLIIILMYASSGKRVWRETKAVVSETLYEEVQAPEVVETEETDDMLEDTAAEDQQASDENRRRLKHQFYDFQMQQQLYDIQRQQQEQINQMVRQQQLYQMQQQMQNQQMQQQMLNNYRQQP
jgi:WD40 repeat protein/serine/threonine protein kinase